MDQQLALIELYEYKVKDFLEGRLSRGGRRGLLELRETLLHTELNAVQIRRFSRVDRQFRLYRHAQPQTGEIQVVEPALAAPPSAALLATNDSAHATAERAAWADLQELVWLSGLRERLFALGQELRQEPGHATLRVIYAATETAERTLRGENTAFPVPVSDDPLLSLADREIAQGLMETLSGLLYTHDGAEAVMQAIDRIHAQPFPRHTDEDVLAARIESAEREPISQAAREELIRALRLQYPQAADPRERPAVRHASDQLRQLLAAFLAAKPYALGVPDQSVLYSEQARTSQAVPSEDSQQLVIYLGGEGQDAYWHGLHLRWQHSGQDWQLMLDKQLLLLRPSLEAAQRYLSVRVGEDALQVYHSGDYVLLHHTKIPHEMLSQLAREAQVTAQLMDSTRDYANLRLGRAVARLLRDGQVNTDEFTAAAASKYNAVDASELLEFSRRGANTLLTRTSQYPANQLRQVFEYCASQLHISVRHVDDIMQTLGPVRVKVNQAYGKPPQSLNVRSDGEFEAVQVTDGPLNLNFGGRTLTLSRDYKGDLAVLLPGGMAGEKAVLRDLLVVNLGDTSVVLIHWQQWVAVSAQPVRKT